MISFTFPELPSLEGRSFVGEWRLLEQERIGEFDSSTYVDDEAAGYAFDDYPADEAGGFLMFEGLHTLGMVLPLIETGLLIRDRSATGLVYGLDRVRFTSPVYVGDRLRAVGTVESVTPRNGGHLMRIATVVEIEGRPKPAYVVDFLLLWFPVGTRDLSDPKAAAS